MLKKCNRIMAFLLALVLVITTFKSDYNGLRVFAGEDDGITVDADETEAIEETKETEETKGTEGRKGAEGAGRKGAAVNGDFLVAPSLKPLGALSSLESLSSLVSLEGGANG